MVGTPATVTVTGWVDGAMDRVPGIAAEYVIPSEPDIVLPAGGTLMLAVPVLVLLATEFSVALPIASFLASVMAKLILDATFLVGRTTNSSFCVNDPEVRLKLTPSTV